MNAGEFDMTFKKAAAALPILLLATTAVRADVTANVGWASDYWFRGIFQAASSASGGIDYENQGFYVGTWAADVGDGLEVDGYFGWNGEYKELSYGAGFTGYYYTGDFDDTYQEFNLNVGYGFATLDVALGEYDNFGGATEDYSYYALTLEQNGFYAKYAGFGRDFDGDYLELGYGFDVQGLDLGLALIVADDAATNETDETLVFSIGKTFQLQ
jgi:hypothetical protein